MNYYRFVLMNRKQFVYIIALVLLFNQAFSQNNRNAPVTDQHTLDIIAKKTSETMSLKSNFRQVKKLQMLSEEIVSTGIFVFRKPGNARMEYTEPFKYLLIINKDRITIRDNQKTKSYSAGSNKMFTLINRMILDCVSGNILNNRDFVAEVSMNTKEYLVQLSPTQKTLKDFFSSIHVTLDKGDCSIISMEILEPTGDSTVITFTDKERNVSIPDSAFVIE